MVSVCAPWSVAKGRPCREDFVVVIVSGAVCRSLPVGSKGWPVWFGAIGEDVMGDMGDVRGEGDGRGCETVIKRIRGKGRSVCRGLASV